MADTDKRYYRKNTELFRLIDKIRLWPSRSGRLHGIKSLEAAGEYLILTTHCGEVLRMRDSRHSRAARWLRNKWVVCPCPKCKVPQWKLDKYSQTYFSQYFGSDLKRGQ